MKKRLLIYGAGAIGRGYVPWLFPSKDYEFSFVESNSVLCRALQSKKVFTTFRTKNNRYEKLVCQIENCFLPGKEIPTKYDAIITAVGPRNTLALKDKLAKVDCPIVLFENDMTLVNALRNLTGSTKIYFGIPDVITSNTAPQKLLDKDSLSLVTEDGECFVDSGAGELGGFINYVDEIELKKQWMAKLYIHNTAHCVAAYLGSQCGKTYLHEGMQLPVVYNIVEGVMGEMKNMLHVKYNIESEFVDYYAKKELSRFSNLLLYDPIIRVAREPFRKLAPNNRLIGAAQLALFSGIVPENLIIGILSAFLYDKADDSDYNIKYLVNALSPESFLKLIIRLNSHEALYLLILNRWDSIISKLNNLPYE